MLHQVAKCLDYGSFQDRRHRARKLMLWTGLYGWRLALVTWWVERSSGGDRGRRRGVRESQHVVEEGEELSCVLGGLEDAVVLLLVHDAGQVEQADCRVDVDAKLKRVGGALTSRLRLSLRLASLVGPFHLSMLALFLGVSQPFARSTLILLKGSVLQH